ncbi:N-acetylmuramoyl-L-alanine amidase [Cyanobium sp. LEGE 06143]|uniref:N-acetylmuramoyl-L-alanine amidase n=1 Tax=Cyanobium sp. LEGE 06143 TaxID=945727 RepID=UPI0018802F8D|nr:N-acetylmuramoyl-L-alanine amidase [Cyanobium sp. LEGE 06143]MBE9171536.1 N-acetylmuramoyl-L-alanine amidase [Cyanobium sp. LEGE 06143]
MPLRRSGSARSPRRLGLLRLLLAVALVLADLPALASSLAAWRITRQGALELRTSPNVRLQAFFEDGTRLRGPRVWVDLPGAPSRSRSIRGSGDVREVRIGKPTPTTTRIVVEFRPGTQLDPADLRLVGTASDRWKLEFKGLRRPVLLGLGEGDVDRRTPVASRRSPSFPTASTPLSADGLPVVPRGRFRVVIDPGHGGPDPGAVGIRGLRETDIVLDVSLQVARLLQARGVNVVMTRTSEVDVDLPPRVALANRVGADAFVSIHANALSMARPDVNGVETFYFSGGRSLRLARALQAQMMSVSPGSPDRGVKAGRFFVIRRTVMPASLVEMGFVTGAFDAPRLADPSHRRRLAMALATGILQFLGGR